MGINKSKANLKWAMLVLLVAIMCTFIAGGLTSVLVGQNGSAAKKLKLFDGKPKVIIVNGYSTSFQWPR